MSSPWRPYRTNHHLSFKAYLRPGKCRSLQISLFSVFPRLLAGRPPNSAIVPFPVMISYAMHGAAPTSSQLFTMTGWPVNVPRPSSSQWLGYLGCHAVTVASNEEAAYFIPRFFKARVGGAWTAPIYVGREPEASRKLGLSLQASVPSRAISPLDSFFSPRAFFVPPQLFIFQVHVPKARNVRRSCCRSAGANGTSTDCGQ